MEYYRELSLDDPFRRTEREKKSVKDDGDLFGLRRRARQLRVLLDIASFKEPTTHDERQTAQIFMRLLDYDSIEAWRIDMSKVNEAGDESENDYHTVYLHSNKPDSMGPYGAPGPSYGLRRVDDSQNSLSTSVSPLIDIVKDIRDLKDRGTEVVGVGPDDVLRNVLLTQTAQKLGMDIVVSQAVTVGRSDIPSNHQANVFAPEQAIPIVAHYLRSQQIYVINPLSKLKATRIKFYQEAVCAMAPRIWHWLGNCQQSLDSRYLLDTREMIGRLQRAIKAFDDLRFHMGSYPDIEIYDDIGDCVDRVLVNLCGAVDIMARSLHHALALPGLPKDVKLHLKSWYKKNLRPFYAEAKAIQQLDEAQEALESVFKLRNTIHSTALQATGASEEPASYVELDRGRINLVVPHDTYDSLRHDDRAAWGLSVTDDGIIAADLATVTATALNRVCRFLDRMCWVASFERVPNKADFLHVNVVQAFSDIGPINIAMVERMLGLQSAAHDDATNAPYYLPSQAVAAHQRSRREN